MIWHKTSALKIQMKYFLFLAYYIQVSIDIVLERFIKYCFDNYNWTICEISVITKEKVVVIIIQPNKIPP